MKKQIINVFIWIFERTNKNSTAQVQGNLNKTFNNINKFYKKCLFLKVSDIYIFSYERELESNDLRGDATPS